MFRPSAVDASLTPTEQASCAARYGSASALIDWLSFSVIPVDGNGLDWIASVLDDLFDIKTARWQHTGRGWFGYTCRINLGEWGLLAYGGERQRGTVHIELNAHACARILNWSRVQAFGESSGAWITRVDLAHDDFSGEVANISRMLAWYRDGSFTTAGRPPKANLRDDLGSNDGKTFYVGNRKHGKTLRGYEKGKQLGDPTDPWFRIEAELHNKGRVIPWNVLTDPGRYFAGTYPCLASFNAEQSRIATNKRTVELTYQRMERWVGDAAGKALNVMLKVNDFDAERMLRKVVKPGKPKRLAGYSAADFALIEVAE